MAKQHTIARTRSPRLRRVRAATKVLAVLAVAGCLALVLGGCQISQDAINKDPFLQELVAATNNGKQTTQSTLTIGKPFTLHNTTWTVKSYQAGYALRMGSTVLHAHGVYVVVRFTLVNKSGSAQPPESDMLVLQSGSGKQQKTYQADNATTAKYVAWTNEKNFLSDTLKTNTPYSLALVFDIPRNAGGFSLQFHSYPDPNVYQPTM